MADETIVPETQESAVPSVEATPEVAKPAKRKTRQRCNYVLLRISEDNSALYEAAGCAKSYRQALKHLYAAAPGSYEVACFRSKHTVSQKTVNVVE